MRWFVEISPLGTKAAPSTTLCVEAPQWQPALQKARALRGDNGALANFSIELLDDGFRAIDPMTRLRYVVKRAPDETPLSNGSPPAAAAPAEAAKPADPAPAKAEPAPEPAQKRAMAQTVAYTSKGAAAVHEQPAAAAKADLGQTVAYTSKGSAVVREAAPKADLGQTVAYGSSGAVAVRDAEIAKAEAAKAKVEPVKPEPAKPEPAKPEPARPEPARAEPAKPEPAKLSFVLVASREDDPSEASPLTYREQVLAVAAGTPEEDARGLILDRFAHVRDTLDPSRMGRMINLAVFDHVFQGKPQRRPLVTLTWKDWKGDEPELRFPTRDAESGRTSTPAPITIPPQPAKPEPQAAKPEPQAAKPEPIAPTPAVTRTVPKPAEPTPVATTLSSAKPVTLPRHTPSPEVPVIAAPTPVKIADAAPAPAKVEPAKVEPAKTEPAKPETPSPDSAAETRPIPTIASPSVEEEIAVDTEETEPLALRPAASAPAKVEAPKPAATPQPIVAPAVKSTPPSAPAPIKPAPPAKPKKRLSGDDLITELFEAFGDLHFLRDALEGAEFVLELTMEKLPCEIGLVSLFDMNKREFVIVRQAGGPRSALCARQPERAPLALQAMRKRHAIVVADKDGAARAMDDRFRAVGVELSSLVCAPVELGGRYLGLIEIGNPLDGGAFNEGDGNALTYIGQQFGEFLATHGVIVDPAQIREPRPSNPPPAPPRAGSPPKKSR